MVTGAAGGLGGGLVRALVAAGATAVIAADLDEPAGFASPVVPRRLDVGDEDATLALVDEVEGSTGPIALWFANAGVATGGGPERGEADWTAQWRVNVMGHVHAAKALLPRWLERGEGHLITTASAAGLLTTLGDGIYATTKHAAVGFAEWMAITYGDQGIRVSCVCPGALNTPMLARAAGGDTDEASKRIGGGDVLGPDEAAARIVAGTIEERFLILTHPDMHDLILRKADDPERWIRGMRRMWARTQQAR